MLKSKSDDENSLSLDEMFDGQLQNFADISETLDIMNACLKKLAKNQNELIKRVDKLEKESKNK